MKRGFTLLELMIVIIILGVLATLGVMQYQAAIEKARGAEARVVLGQLRIQCAAIYMAERKTDSCTAGNLRIGLTKDMVPLDCRGTHFFEYEIAAQSGDSLTILARRCTANGKTPQASTPAVLRLVTDFAQGIDIWSSDGGY